MADNCPRPAVLLELALERLDPGAVAAVRRHVDGCARCGALVARVRAVHGAAADAPASSCLDEGALAALADGVLERAALDSALTHLAQCPTCRRSLGALTALLEEPAISREIARVERVHAPNRRWAVAGGLLVLTAAAGLAVTVLPPRAPTPAVHRDSLPPGASRPAAIEPLGVVTVVAAFRWQPADDADRYELLLFGGDGTVLWEVTTDQTFVVPPDSVALAPGASYFWRVRGRVGPDQWTESPLHSFSVREP